MSVTMESLAAHRRSQTPYQSNSFVYTRRFLERAGRHIYSLHYSETDKTVRFNRDELVNLQKVVGEILAAHDD